MQAMCMCGKWIAEVEPGIWCHEDDMLVCIPDEGLSITYLDEVSS